MDFNERNEMLVLSRKMNEEVRFERNGKTGILKSLGTTLSRRAKFAIAIDGKMIVKEFPVNEEMTVEVGGESLRIVVLYVGKSQTKFGFEDPSKLTTFIRGELAAAS